MPVTSPDCQAAPEQVAWLFHDKPGFIWLDGDTSRHFIFRDPLASISCDGALATIHGPNGISRFPCSSLDLVEAALTAWGGPSGGTLAGIIGYDVAAELEDVGCPCEGPSEFPRVHLGLYDSVLIAHSGRWSIVGTDAWRGMHGLPFSAGKEEDMLRTARAGSRTLKDELTIFSAGPPVDRAKGSFRSSVDTIVKRIHNGDFFQTNLCRHLEAPLHPDMAWPLYGRMRKLSPSQYGAFLQLGGGRSVFSNSPEMFLKVEGGGVETRPIKGTRRRGRAEEEDYTLRDELLGNPKDAAELAMIVDVSRNDLSRVCVPGSVKVAKHASLLTLPLVHHMFSSIVGRLRSDATVIDLLRASFPAASITGAPKIAAIQAAFEEEGRLRGPCMGSIGWISLDGQLELSVAIRTAFTNAGKVGYLAGCGITSDSVSLQELQESELKAAAFIEALATVTGCAES